MAIEDIVVLYVDYVVRLFSLILKGVVVVAFFLSKVKILNIRLLFLLSRIIVYKVEVHVLRLRLGFKFGLIAEIHVQKLV